MVVNEVKLLKTLEALKSDSSYEYTTDKKCNPNIIFTAANGESWPIHSRYDAKREADSFAEKHYNEQYKNLILLGMGLGYAIKAFTALLRPEQVLHVFETNLNLLKYAFEQTDIRVFLQHEQVFFYASGNFDDLFKYFYETISNGSTIITMYQPDLLTSSETIAQIAKCHKFISIKTGKMTSTAGIDIVKQLFSYAPTPTKQKYRITFINFYPESFMIDSFWDNLRLAFEYMGHIVTSIEFNDFIYSYATAKAANTAGSYFSASTDLFIVCNALTLDLKITDKVNVPFLSLGLDRPYHLRSFFNNGLKNVIYTWCENSDVAYAQRHYFPDGKSYFLAHGGEINFDYSEIFKRDRFVDLIISCNHQLQNDIEALRGTELGFDMGLIYQIAEYYETSMLPLEECAAKLLAEAAGSCSDELLRKFMTEAGISIDQYIRNIKKCKTIKALADSGIRIHVIGGWWELSELYTHPMIIFHGVVSCEECRLLFEHSKILINILPSFYDGAHERIFSSMMRGALCITECNPYLESTFKDGVNIAFYDKQNLDELIRKTKYYLSHDDERLSVTKAAFEYVRDRHTWINRAEEIINIYDDFTNTASGVSV